MAASTIANLGSVFKPLYQKGEVENICVRKHEFLKRVKKVDDFYGDGDYKKIPLRYTNPQGIGATFSTAQGNASSSKHKQFVIDRKKGYGFITLAAEAMIASERDVGSYIRAKKYELDNTIEQMGNDLGLYLYGDGWGALGVLDTYASGTTLTLTPKADAYKFEVGMQLRAADGADSSTPRTGTMVVTAVDWDAGTIVVDAAATSLATGDYLFREGDADMAGTTKLLPTGLAGWIPLTAPSSTSFFGVDRTAHITRLAGHRVDNSSNSIEESVMDLANKIRLGGGMPDALLINPVNAVTLMKSVGSKVQYEGGGGTMVVGPEKVKIATTAGVLEVVIDADCPTNRGYILQMDTWKFHTMREVPHIVDDDGVQAQRHATADEIEVRLRWFGNLGCEAPGFNGVFSI